MPQDAPPNGSAPGPAPEGPWTRVAGIQAKLHRWAAADPGRRFDDLFNLVHGSARCAERRTAGAARGPGKRAGGNPGTAPRAYSTTTWR